MNISPVAFHSFSPARVNFKGNDKPSPASKPEPSSESKQNNSVEIFIPTQTYLDMTIKGTVNKVFDDLENPDSDLAKTVEHDKGKFDIDSGDFDEEEFEASIAQGAAGSVIYSLQTVAEQMGLVPEELKGKVPVFVLSSVDDYIDFMERGILEQEKLLETGGIQLPDIDDINNNPDMDKFSDEEKEQAANLLGMVQAQFEDGTMQEILNSQKALAEILKTQKRDELEGALDALNESTNYALYKAINAGFNRDAREVVNLLTAGTVQYIEPIVEDNGDGTSTYTYVNIFSSIKVVKNNDNGDFISAEGTKNGLPSFSVKFRENGTIEELDYSSPVDNSAIIIKTNANSGKIKTAHFFPKKGDGLVMAREFERQEDGTLKLTSFNTFVRK